MNMKAVTKEYSLKKEQARNSLLFIEENLEIGRSRTESIKTISLWKVQVKLC